MPRDTTYVRGDQCRPAQLDWSSSQTGLCALKVVGTKSGAGVTWPMMVFLHERFYIACFITQARRHKEYAWHRGRCLTVITRNSFIFTGNAVRLMNELPQVTHQRQQQGISMISNAEHMEEDALKVLAPELLQNVIKYLPKQDLKHLRSTCSRLVGFVNHSLFDSIFLSVDPRHLVIATMMLQRFGPALRTVIISPLEYRGLEQFDHHRNLRRTPDTHTKLSSNHSIYKEHRDRAYKWHRALVARQNRNKCQDCLQQVLRHAPNLRKVIFTHRNCSITDQELEEICCWESNWKSCPLDRETHNTFRLSP